jgi:ABC-type antimicrobial peptide transport system permease subunit
LSLHAAIPRLVVPLAHAFREALASLRRERRRFLPMAVGIVCGMAIVMVLLAIAGGFEASQKQALSAYGDRFVLVRLNRAELDRAAGGKERRLMMDEHDLERLRVGAPAIRRFSPVNMAYRARLFGSTGPAGTNAWIAGVLPEMAQIRTLPLREGRFVDDFDEADRRRVMVLGPQARKQLFGSGPAVGQTVRVTGFSTSSLAPPSMTPASGASPLSSATSSSSTSSTGAPRSSSPTPSSGTTPTPGSATGSSRSTPTVSTWPPSIAAPRGNAPPDVSISAEIFTVIGVLDDIETTKESYVSVARMAYVPFSTSTAIFDRRFITIMLEPRTTADRDLALRQFKQVMGARYGFGPEDRNAVIIYFDAIERARSIESIFGYVRFFLGAVGVLILAIGGIGVMNVVLVSVTARTFEIGLRRALGATPLVISAQFFLEALLACLLSGAVGFLLGAGGIGLLQLFPLPEALSIGLDIHTASISFGLLSLTAVLVGIYPARRASLLLPVAALQSRA